MYHYPDESRKRIETNKSELPVDVDNHTIDAIRYGYYNTFPELFNEPDDTEDIVVYGPEDFGIDLARVRIDGDDSEREFYIDDAYSDYERSFELT